MQDAMESELGVYFPMLIWIGSLFPNVADVSVGVLTYSEIQLTVQYVKYTDLIIIKWLTFDVWLIIHFQ